MKVGLIDVDGHNFPNLALMKFSAIHKDLGWVNSPRIFWCVDNFDDYQKEEKK